MKSLILSFEVLSHFLDPSMTESLDGSNSPVNTFTVHLKSYICISWPKD